MPVYVDNERNAFGRMVMCHMIADSLDELHAMADALGMRRTWFQQPPKASMPHYDLSLSTRAKAVELGAIACDRRTFVAHLKRIRTELVAAVQAGRCPPFPHDPDAAVMRPDGNRSERAP